ncbi:MAG TPA: BamA/TamA family outer membrane protein, partial [Holophaga sp.]|nr:BamA/TamA family outer membrane protein [Holophaga sp.]
APDRVRSLEIGGRLGPFTVEKLTRKSGVQPGRTLWTRETELEVGRNLRKAMMDDDRFEARVDLAWDGASGVLKVNVDAGPVVRLVRKGPGLGWTTSIKDLVPLARADRYGPELLDEGERRIVRLLRSKGHLDPQVSHTREVLREGPGGPEEVRVTYTLVPGPVAKVDSVAFEGSKAVPEAELRRAVELGGLFRPKARPEILDAIERRVEALYESLGFADARVRRSVEVKGDRARILFRIREGNRRMVSSVRLELPPDGLGDPWGLAECLPLLFSDKAPHAQGPGPRTYRSDRPSMEGVEATLAREEGEDGPAFVLSLSRPIPFRKADVFRVYTALRQQHLVALGVVRPVVWTDNLPLQGGTSAVRFRIPPQSREEVRRLVVRGADRTRAEAVLREVGLKPGDPLDTDRLIGAQGRLGSLGAFSRVEFASLGEPREEKGPPSPWKPGDLALHAEERSPWVLTNSFGYDSSQGYYLGQGVQRLNVGGMGRTLDLNIRAGDGTINNPTLRDIFRTGRYTRSLDSYSLAYSDPWFSPGALGRLLPDRTAFRAEGAYIQEQRYIYNVHRRRVLGSLRWGVSPRVNVEAGYRFERVEVRANVDGISEEDLAAIARNPAHAIISSPYVQIVRDTRDNPFDPTSGSFALARFEAAGQAFGTSDNASFLKLDLRSQWTWPIGYKARAGVVSLGLRAAVARPTANSSQDLPLAERFFGGGSGTQRGVQPDYLGPLGQVPLLDSAGQPQYPTGPNGLPDTTQPPLRQAIPLGGQALVVANLEYRFPLIGQSVWAEVFVDSAQVYERLTRSTITDRSGAVRTTSFPPLRTSVGIGLIFKVGVPLKVEYAQDVNRLLDRPRSADDVNTQLRNILISAGFQF